VSKNVASSGKKISGFVVVIFTSKMFEFPVEGDGYLSFDDLELFKKDNPDWMKF
jgi:hypothetical protein